MSSQKDYKRTDLSDSKSKKTNSRMNLSTTQKRYSRAPSLKTLKQKGYDKYCTYPADSVNRLGDWDTEIDESYKKQCVLDKMSGQYIYAKYAGVSRVITMNVHNFVIMCEHISPARNLDFITAFLKLTSADILCLQEVAPIRPSGTPETLTDPTELQKLNYDYVIQQMSDTGWEYNLLANNTGGRDYSLTSLGCYYPLANAIFSRHPLTDKKVVILPGNRTILLATVELDGITTMIVNTHLEYKKKDKDGAALKHEYGEENILVLQANLTLETIKRELARRKLTSVICCGDFNFNISKVSHLAEINKYFKFGKQKGITNLFFQDTKDYVLLNDSQEWSAIDNRPLVNAISDHFPVLLDLIPTTKLSTPNAQMAIKKIQFQNTINISIFGYNSVNIPGASDKYNNISYHISDELINNYDFTYPTWWASNNIDSGLKTDVFDYHITAQQMEMEFSTVNRGRMSALTKLAKKLSGSPVNLMKELSLVSPVAAKDLEMDIDEIMLYYLKSRQNLKTIILWPACGWDKDKDRFRDTLRLLGSNGNIFYSKRFLLTYSEAASLIFAVYSTTDRNKDMSNIDFNTGMKGWNKKNPNEKRPIFVIFYEYTAGEQTQITGTQAFFKNQVRDIWKNDSIRIYDILHISDYYTEAVDNCQLFLNRNSMRMLGTQNIYRFTKLLDRGVYTMINLLKSVMNNHFTVLDRNRFNIVSSFGLLVMGIRQPNDIDGHMLGNINDCSPDFRKKYRNYFTILGDNYLPFIDLAMPGTLRYEDYMVPYYHKLALLFDAASYDEIILNPRYHQYFCGIKFPIIPIDLAKRVYRFKPKSLADIISIDKLTQYRLRLPSIPDKIDFYYKDKVSPSYITKLIVSYLKKEYNLTVSLDEVKSYFTKYDTTRDINTIDVPRDRYIFFKICGFLMNYYEDFKHLIPKKAADAGIRQSESS